VLNVPPNKRLKLTEPAAGECAARQSAGVPMIDKYVRAMNYIAGTDRRRSLAAIR